MDDGSPARAHTNESEKRSNGECGSGWARYPLKILISLGISDERTFFPLHINYVYSISCNAACSFATEIFVVFIYSIHYDFKYTLYILSGFGIGMTVYYWIVCWPFVRINDYANIFFGTSERCRHKSQDQMWYSFETIWALCARITKLSMSVFTNNEGSCMQNRSTVNSWPLAKHANRTAIIAAASCD